MEMEIKLKKVDLEDVIEVLKNIDDNYWYGNKSKTLSVFIENDNATIKYSEEEVNEPRRSN